MRKLKLSSLKGLDKFQAALMNDGLPAMVGWLKSKKKAGLLMTEVHKHIFELGPPTPPGKPTGRSRYYQWLMQHVSEILTSIDTMKDIEFYAGRFPYAEEVTADFVYVRLHGSRQLYVSGYTSRELNEWARRIRGWCLGDSGTKGRDVYVYFDNDAKVHAPHDAIALTERAVDLGVNVPGKTLLV